MTFWNQGGDTMTASTPVSQSGRREPRLLDRLSEAIRARHMSKRTEEAYVQWVRRYILFHGRRHPSELGEREINAFLTTL
ncbi:MAG TPA: site-specific integrase, partial [Thermoanaerobaculia bacterium]|nr:site-specific integrase [Thermoanaerobaculia bacterium]